MTEQTVGVHLLANVYDVNPSLLEKMEIGIPLLERIITELQLHVVSKTGYQFQPVGYTYAFVLSESHFTIHTYPEYRSCFIDIFCCNREFDSIKAVELLKECFGTSRIVHQIIVR